VGPDISVLCIVASATKHDIDS